jgi:hypothetical protein
MSCNIEGDYNMSLEIVREDEVRYNKNRYKIKCRLCGSFETKVKIDGKPIWNKDKNSRGEWTNMFICYGCAYERPKSCCKCGDDTNKHIAKFYDDKGIWTGEHICDYCQHKERTEFRNKNIELKLDIPKGSIGDTIISKILEIPACSIYAGDLRLPFGLIHGYYGIVGVKIAKLKNGKCNFYSNGRISADTYFYLGFGEDYKNIEIVYILPSDILKSTNGRLCIYRNSIKHLQYKVDPGPYNDVYHSMAIRSVEKMGSIDNKMTKT